MENVGQGVPLCSSLQEQEESVVGDSPAEGPVLRSLHVVGSGGDHLVNGVDSAERARLWALGIEWQLERKNFSLAHQSGRLGDLVSGDVIESAEFVIGAPAAPIPVRAAVFVE